MGSPRPSDHHREAASAPTSETRTNPAATHHEARPARPGRLGDACRRLESSAARCLCTVIRTTTGHRQWRAVGYSPAIRPDPVGEFGGLGRRVVRGGGLARAEVAPWRSARSRSRRPRRPRRGPARQPVPAAARPARRGVRPVPTSPTSTHGAASPPARPGAGRWSRSCRSARASATGQAACAGRGRIVVRTSSPSTRKDAGLDVSALCELKRPPARARRRRARPTACRVPHAKGGRSRPAGAAATGTPALAAVAPGRPARRRAARTARALRPTHRGHGARPGGAPEREA